MRAETLILDASTDRWPDEAAFFAELMRLPLAEQAHVLRKKTPAARRAAALGRLLLLDALARLGLPLSLINSMQYAPSGRPFLAAGPAFNISHSQDRVVCAVTPGARRVGVDVEAVRPFSADAFADLAETMTPAQWALIHADPAPARRFLAFWTMKESVVKATGRGLALPLGDLAGNGPLLSWPDGETWAVAEVAFGDDYVGHVATRVG